MSWIRIDSGLWRDPRWRSLSPGARALFVDLLGISGDRDSDGAVDRTAFALATVDLAPGEAVSIAEELVSAGFLEVCGTGRQVVDPFAYLRPRSEVEADRRQRVEAAALGGAARGRDGARGPDGKYVKPAAPAENPAERVAERVERVDQPTSQPQASPVTVPVPVGRKVSIPSLTLRQERNRPRRPADVGERGPATRLRVLPGIDRLQGMAPSMEVPTERPPTGDPRTDLRGAPRSGRRLDLRSAGRKHIRRRSVHPGAGTEGQ